MSAFFVGQRVRVKLVDNPVCPVPIGAEGRIIGERASWIFPGSDEWQIHAGGFNCSIIKEEASDYLEPIVPPHEACDADFKADLDRLLERQGVAA